MKFTFEGDKAEFYSLMCDMADGYRTPRATFHGFTTMVKDTSGADPQPPTDPLIKQTLDPHGPKDDSANQKTFGGPASAWGAVRDPETRDKLVSAHERTSFLLPDDFDAQDFLKRHTTEPCCRDCDETARVVAKMNERIRGLEDARADYLRTMDVARPLAASVASLKTSGAEIVAAMKDTTSVIAEMSERIAELEKRAARGTNWDTSVELDETQKRVDRLEETYRIIAAEAHNAKVGVQEINSSVSAREQRLADHERRVCKLERLVFKLELANSFAVGEIKKALRRTRQLTLPAAGGDALRQAWEKEDEQS